MHKRDILMGGYAPLGYKIVTVDCGTYKKKKLEIDPISSKAVEKIFQLRAEETKIDHIIDILNHEGHKNINGKPFTRNSLQTMLKNKRYIGTNMYNDEEFPNTIPAIIDKKLFDKVNEEYNTRKIFPASEDIFNAFHLTPLADVKVVILGQDPYHNDGQAHGLCFSVKPDVEIPPSLVNIYQELHDDLGCTIPNNGYLVKWADQGILMLNTVLTVRAHQANSHRGKGWEEFTDAAIRALNKQDRPIVFILWGRPAQTKEKMLNNPKHLILKAAHPSPLSAHNGFFGSRPFSQTNKFLQENGIEPIDWQIENK